MIKSIGAFVVLVMSVSLMFVCSPATAAEIGLESGQPDLLMLLGMLLDSWSDLSWTERLIILAFCCIPTASFFTAIVPTPKPGTLWSAIYFVIEKASLSFYRSKDKYADTIARTIDKKPLDLKKDKSDKLDKVAETLGKVALDAATGGPVKVVLGLLRKLF